MRDIMDYLRGAATIFDLAGTCDAPDIMSDEEALQANWQAVKNDLNTVWERFRTN